MISHEHLLHWLSEIKYALNGMSTEISKEGLVKEPGVMVNGSFYSFEYVREKLGTINRLIDCIMNDIENDDVGEPVA